MNNSYTETLALYKAIDQTIDEHFDQHKKQAPCAKGCASCCSQFFEISELEFILLTEFILTLPIEQQEKFKERANILFTSFKEHWPSFYEAYFTPTTVTSHSYEYYQHPERHKVVMPCVFLSEEGACQVYERRPLVCRTTGVGYQYLYNPGAVCNVIRRGLFTPLWQADLREFKPAIDAVRWLPDDSNEMGVKRQYPMFYYVYDWMVNHPFFYSCDLS